MAIFISYIGENLFLKWCKTAKKTPPLSFLILSLPLRLAAVQRGVADVLRMHRRNNGQKVYLPEIDAGGRPETGILLGVAL